MARATFLKYQIDPEGIKTPDDETDKKILNDLQEGIASKEVDELPITSWWAGIIIKNAYNSELEVCQDNLPTMDDVSFKFNSIVSGIVVRNEKDIQNNAPVRKTLHFQKDIGSVLEDEYKRNADRYGEIFKIMISAHRCSLVEEMFLC